MSEVDEGVLAEAAALVGRSNVLVDVAARPPNYALEAGVLHRIWNVIADDLEPDPSTINVSDARKRSESVDIGDELAEPLDDPDIARVARYLRGGGADAKLPIELAPSSIGVLVLGGGLDGLDASVGTRRAVVDWMRLELDDFHEGPRWYVRSCITITDGARTWRGCERVRFGWRVNGRRSTELAPTPWDRDRLPEAAPPARASSMKHVTDLAARTLQFRRL